MSTKIAGGVNVTCVDVVANELSLALAVTCCTFKDMHLTAPVTTTTTIATTSGQQPFQPPFEQENLGLQELRDQNTELLRQNVILEVQYKELWYL